MEGIGFEPLTAVHGIRQSTISKAFLCNRIGKTMKKFKKEPKIEL